MIYLWPGAQSLADYPAFYGVMTAAAHGVVPRGIAEGRRWACDNEAYTRGFDPARMFTHLDHLRPYRAACLFVTVPDVVGEARATLALYAEWSPRFRAEGWPVALVAQDGLESLPWPGDWDALFIGGSTAWKLSAAADWCIRRAKDMGQWVHVGRVNSVKRWQHFDVMGVDSVDGTFPCYEPDTARRRLANAAAQPVLHRLLSAGDCLGESE
jgi:hypothetical protein